MNIQVEVRSLNTSKNSADFTTFKKYDVEISINETENATDHSTLQYAFVITSNPKNARFAMEGTAKLIGSPEQRDEILSKTDGSVPIILTAIYQELFPTLFIMSKSLNVPCPPYKIGGSQMTETPQTENPSTSQESAQAVNTETKTPTVETQPGTETQTDAETQQPNTEPQPTGPQDDASGNLPNENPN
ncbi:MAG: hypothetical protein WAO91_06475 [Candidatus Nitrosotenuis sp.]